MAAVLLPVNWGAEGRMGVGLLPVNCSCCNIFYVSYILSVISGFIKSLSLGGGGEGRIAAGLLPVNGGGENRLGAGLLLVNGGGEGRLGTGC